MLRLTQVEVPAEAETREVHEITHVVVHRIEVSQEDDSFDDTPEEIARFFGEHPIGVAATGGAMPYALLVTAQGELIQTIALRFVCPHVRAHNRSSIGVGVIGDFRRRSPSAPQRAALLGLLAALLQRFSLPISAVVAHDELTDASHDPEKICPGSRLSVESLREELPDILPISLEGLQW